MKNEKQLLSDIVRHFEGLNKIEAHNIIAKLEVLLFYAKTPLTFDSLLQMIEDEVQSPEQIDPYQLTILPNNNFCEYQGSNTYLHIYKEHNRFFPNWNIFTNYYYKTKYAPMALQKLTKNNLLNSFKGKPEFQQLVSFLEKYRATARDLITHEMLILSRG